MPGEWPLWPLLWYHGAAGDGDEWMPGEIVALTGVEWLEAEMGPPTWTSARPLAEGLAMFNLPRGDSFRAGQPFIWQGLCNGNYISFRTPIPVDTTSRDTTVTSGGQSLRGIHYAIPATAFSASHLLDDSILAESDDPLLLEEFVQHPPKGTRCFEPGLDSASRAGCTPPRSLTLRLPEGWQLQLVLEAIENEDGSEGGGNGYFRWRRGQGGWTSWTGDTTQSLCLAIGGLRSHHAWRERDGRIRFVFEGLGCWLEAPAAFPLMQALLVPDSGFVIYPERLFGGQPCD